ncbi:MAG: hypothetical protein QXE16_04360 [Candidatus Bathyarchaeia archaeon]
MPAVSDEDMSPWMEYVYMQQIKPENPRGVNVKLYAIDEKGAATYIDTVCTDPANGGVFRLLWTPPSKGTYIIVAEFEGSESYYPSRATTVVGVEEAPTPPEYATPGQVGSVGSAVESVRSTVESQQFTINVLLALVVIAIVIGVANIFLILRKTSE